MDRGRMGRWGRQAAAALAVLALALGAVQPEAAAATLVVTRFDDPTPNGCVSGTDCSLREAVLLANTNAGLDVIQLPAGVYTLTVAGVDDAANQGDLDFTGPTQIGVTGGLSASVGATSSLFDRIIEVITGSVAVTMTDLVIHGGDPLINTAGGVRVAADTSLWLERVIVRDNLAGAGGGGGILTTGRLTMVDGVVTGNRSPNGGPGGGILAAGNAVVALTNTVVISNTASGPGANGGGIVLSVNARLTMSGGGLISNTAGGDGGGLFVSTNSLANVTGTQVLSNTSLGGGGAINLGRLTVAHSLVRGNTSTVNGGGGLRAQGNLTLTHSAVISNVAAASTGGGLNVSDGVTAVITNVTFSDNRANLSGGGVSAGGTATMFLHHATVVSNVTILGNGGGLNTVLLGGLSNSLVAYNQDLSAGTAQPDCTVGTLSLGYNLIGNSTGCNIIGTLTGVISNTNALVGPLANNGGNTLTHALRLGSPALGAANPATCAATDQRGFGRPAGGCDLGAWEGDPALVFLALVLR